MHDKQTFIVVVGQLVQLASSSLVAVKKTGANSLPINQKFGSQAGPDARQFRQSDFSRLFFPRKVRGPSRFQSASFSNFHAQSSIVHGTKQNSRVNNGGAVNSEPMRKTSDLNLNLSLGTGQPHSATLPAPNLSEPTGSRICSRCLSGNHVRSGCKSNIRRHKCLQEGHIAVNCQGQLSSVRNKL